MRFELPRTLGEPWAHYVRLRNEAAKGQVVRSVWTCHCHFKPKSADHLDKTVKIQQGTNSYSVVCFMLMLLASYNLFSANLFQILYRPPVS
jgi:hypothetical protein